MSVGQQKIEEHQWNLRARAAQLLAVIDERPAAAEDWVCLEQLYEINRAIADVSTALRHVELSIAAFAVRDSYRREAN